MLAQPYSGSCHRTVFAAVLSWALFINAPLQSCADEGWLNCSIGDGSTCTALCVTSKNEAPCETAPACRSALLTAAERGNGYMALVIAPPRLIAPFATAPLGVYGGKFAVNNVLVVFCAPREATRTVPPVSIPLSAPFIFDLPAKDR